MLNDGKLASMVSRVKSMLILFENKALEDNFFAKGNVIIDWAGDAYLNTLM